MCLASYRSCLEVLHGCVVYLEGDLLSRQMPAVEKVLEDTAADTGDVVCKIWQK